MDIRPEIKSEVNHLIGKGQVRVDQTTCLTSTVSIGLDTLSSRKTAWRLGDKLVWLCRSCRPQRGRSGHCAAGMG